MPLHTQEGLSVVEYLDGYLVLALAFKAPLKYVDLTSLINRYYVAIHNLLLPAILEEELALRCYLEPSASVYVQEQKVYVLFAKAPATPESDFLEWGRVPIIEVPPNEPLLVLVAAALAEKVSMSPGDRNLLRALPGHLRAYVEVALNYHRDRETAHGEGDGTIKARPWSKGIIDVVLWQGRSHKEQLREVVYSRGLSLKRLKLVFKDYEVEVRGRGGTLPKEALRVVEGLLPPYVMESVASNVIRAAKIIAVASKLL